MEEKNEINENKEELINDLENEHTEEIKQILKENAKLSTIVSAIITVFGFVLMILATAVWISVFFPNESSKKGLAGLALAFALIILAALAIILSAVGVIIFIVGLSSLITSITIFKQNDLSAKKINSQRKRLIFINLIMYLAGFACLIGGAIFAIGNKNIIYLLICLLFIPFLIFALKQSKSIKKLKAYVQSKE